MRSALALVPILGLLSCAHAGAPSLTTVPAAHSDARPTAQRDCACSSSHSEPQRAESKWGPDIFGGPTREVSRGRELKALADATARFRLDLATAEVPADETAECFRALSSWVVVISMNVHGFLISFVETGECGPLGLDGDRVYAYDPNGEFVRE